MMYFKPKTKPKKWTQKEEQIVNIMHRKGYTNQEIANKLGRTEVSIRNKIRRLNKKKGQGNYDKGHTLEKHLLNQRFIKTINPNTILDLYNGGSTQYNNYNVVTNDINMKFDTDYHYDSLDLIKKFYNEEHYFDVIDCDPFGSCYYLLDYVIPLARKGLIITFGELGHKKFKRLDFVSKHYNINSLEDFNLSYLNKYVINKGYTYFNKKLIPIIAKDWNHIGRIYYKII